MSAQALSPLSLTSLLVVAVVVLSSSLVSDASVKRSANVQCPSGCTCLGNMVDCSKKMLVDIPDNLPHWVEML